MIFRAAYRPVTFATDFYGDEKVYLRLELLQLLLRHQITALIEAWELPDFVEVSKAKPRHLDDKPMLLIPLSSSTDDRSRPMGSRTVRQ